MAIDIFSRRTDVFGGAFASDLATITFPGLGDAAGADYGLLIQRMQTSYQQQVTRLYEVGKPAVYYVGGRTSGDITVDRVIGPRSISSAFYTKFGDVCQAASNSLNFSVQTNCTNTDDNPSGWASYTAFFCVITAISLGVQAADMLINENLRIMFSSFEYTTEAS